MTGIFIYLFQSFSFTIKNNHKDLPIGTLSETNIAPKNRLVGKGDSYRKPSFLGAMLVSGRVVLSHFVSFPFRRKRGKGP